MNKEEILAMTPSKELDWKVAEFMGVNISLFEFGWEAGNHNYSSDISAAWEVLEKFYQYEIKKTKVSWTGMEWFSIWLWKDEGNKSVYEFNFKTAQEAICKAALLAVMEDNQ